MACRDGGGWKDILIFTFAAACIVMIWVGMNTVVAGGYDTFDITLIFLQAGQSRSYLPRHPPRCRPAARHVIYHDLDPHVLSQSHPMTRRALFTRPCL